MDFALFEEGLFLPWLFMFQSCIHLSFLCFKVVFFCLLFMFQSFFLFQLFMFQSRLRANARREALQLSNKRRSEGLLRGLQSLYKRTSKIPKHKKVPIFIFGQIIRLSLPLFKRTSKLPNHKNVFFIIFGQKYMWQDN